MATRSLLSRRGMLAAALASCAAPRLARAVTVLDQIVGDPTYIGQAIVTGTDNRDRPRGLGLCLGQVLIKASGDPNILTAPGFPALRAKAPSLVEAISYHDRMSALPKHDEQGTRDRPFTLTALFGKPQIAAALVELGSKIWAGARPPVFLVTDVQSYSGRFTLLAGSASGYDQPELMRAAIADSTARAALSVSLPASAGAQPPPGALLVNGSLVWSDAADGWIAHWATRHGGQTIAWGERGISFDQAFDAALLGALGVASGHQPPRG
jgi:hypothetical protein